MPLPDIQLDDRDFERLVSDARRRIPGYTPEWTDLNDSDPGMTLVQLFAWLEEMMLWRLNRVPEKNYLEFLKLVGLELRLPAAARGELTFYLATTDLPSSPGPTAEAEPLVVTVPQGTRVLTAESDSDGQITFETDRELNVVATRLRTLQSFDGARFSQLLDQSNDIVGAFFYPFGPQPQQSAAFYLGFDRAFPSSPPGSGPRPYALTIHAYTAGLIGGGPDTCTDLGTPAAPVVAVWEYWAGDTAKWRPLKVSDDTTAGLTRTGTVLFEGPRGAVATKLGLLQKPEDEPLFWFRCRIEQVLGAGYETPPRLEDVVINTVGASNVVTVRGELLGASDGSPNQAFRLANRPVLLDEFTLEVDEGNGFRPWNRVSDFAGSTRTSPDYTLNPATGEIAFGDGEHGKIPGRLTGPRNRPEEDLANIKVSKYRWGGGARGNVGTKKLTSLQNPIPYVDRVANLRPTSGGQDEESVSDAKCRAPQAMRTQSRAVTADDFEFLARQTPGAYIRRAHTLPQHSPNLGPFGPGPQALVPNPGAVTLVVVPDSLSARPVPSEGTRARVTSWLDRHRLVTSELYVVAPRYREVRISARVIVERDATSRRVAETLKQKLLAYFHPLTGGCDGTGWEFGGKIYFSDTYRIILETPGVARLDVKELTTYVDGIPIGPATDVALADDELVFSETHQVIANHS